MARQYWVSSIPPFHVADGTGYTGTAAIGDISPAPGIVLPANILEPGSRLRLQAFGKYTSTATPGTVILGFYIGTGSIASGQAVGAIAATTVGTSKTNQTWKMDGEVAVRTHGTSGTALGCVDVVGVAGGTAGDIVLGPLTGLTTTTIDTTVALKVMVGATPSVTTGTWTCMYLGVELLS